MQTEINLRRRFNQFEITGSTKRDADTKKKNFYKYDKY